MESSRFPSLPDFKAHWVAIQLEPLPGSSERLTAVIAVQSQSGEYLVAPALSPSKVECMFGERSQAYRQIVSRITESLTLQAEQGNSIETWQPIFEGASLFDGGTGFGTDLASVFGQAARLVSAFAETTPQSIWPETEIPHPRLRTPVWLTSVKKSIESTFPECKNNFHKKHVLGSTEIQIDYEAANYFAGLGAYSRTERLNAIKRRLFDLVAWRIRLADLSSKDSEFIFKDPDTNEMSNDEVRNYIDELDWVTAFCASNGMPLYKVKDNEMAAHRLAIKSRANPILEF